MSTVTVQQRRQYPAWNHLAHGGGELAGSRRVAGGDIGGMLRFKYFRRPMVPYLQSVPPDVLLAREEAVAEALPPRAEPMSKTVGTQSDYRENEVRRTPTPPTTQCARAPPPSCSRWSR